MVKSKVCVGQFLLPKFLGIQGAIKGNMDDLGWGAPPRYPVRNISQVVPFFF